MRLFIAVNFNDEIKDKICTVIQKMKAYTRKGNFTSRDNLHLTLAFIGETSRLNEVRQAMDAISAEPFIITLSGIGKFSRDGGDIYWIGVNKNSKLVQTRNQLCEELRRRGFQIDEREFKPHLTLGREVVLNDGVDRSMFADAISPVSMKVTKISLMKSERINGKLTYTEIYSRILENGAGL